MSRLQAIADAARREAKRARVRAKNRRAYEALRADPERLAARNASLAASRALRLQDPVKLAARKAQVRDANARRYQARKATPCAPP